jgi:hypothetical protein
LAETAPSPVQALLQQRERELLEAHWHAWLRPICRTLGEPLPIAHSQHGRYTLEWLNTARQAHRVFQRGTGNGKAHFHCGQFRRGFFAHVSLVAKPYRGPQQIASLVERTPIDGLTLIEYGGRELCATLEAARPTQLRSLELIFSDNEGVAAVVQMPGLEQLRDLVVRSVRNSTTVAEVLRHGAVFQQLRTLSITSCELAEAHLRELLRLPWVQQCERFELVDCGLTDRHARILAEAWPAALRHVDLSANRFTVTGLMLLRECHAAIGLTTPDYRAWPERFYW